MIASRVTVDERGGGAMLSACVKSAASALESARLEWIVRDGPPEWLTGPGDALLAALLLPAMRAGEDLVIEAAVSPRLREQAQTIMDIYQAWVPGLRAARRPNIVAPAASPAPSTGGTGLFFSCGVDSFYSLLRRTTAQSEGEAAAKHLSLVLAYGFDIRSGNRPLFQQIARSARRVADETGRSLVIVETNVRSFSDPRVGWDFYHGAALASMGLLLGGLFDTVVIPSTHDYGELVPWGSHPLLDPLWSTETVRFVHDGCEASRTEKVRHVAASPLALATLRVCWPDWGEEYNCGRCEKCIRTMLALHLAGVLSRSETFSPTLEPALVRSLQLVTGDSSARVLKDLLRALEGREEDHALAEAVRHVLRRERLKLWMRGSIPSPIRHVVRALRRRPSIRGPIGRRPVRTAVGAR
jgi:hypothetical protein